MAEVKYQELTQFNSPNYTPFAQVRSVYGLPRTIDGVTYHWWGDPANNPQFQNIINYLCRSNGNSSAHVVGESGRVAWIVDAINAAWHAGNARGNATQIGYECNPRLQDGDYQTMGQFHYTMERAYGKRLAIYVHKEWSNTACSPINKGYIRQIADQLHASDAAPQPAPIRETAREVFNPLKRFIVAQDCILENIPNGGNVGTRVYPKGESIDIKHKLTMSDGSVWYRTGYSADKELASGFRAANLTPYVEPTPDPEWIRNLKTYSGAKLSALPAAGVKVLNLTTFAPVNDTIIPKGTQVDIVRETTIGGKKYYISSYAFERSLPWGIPADQLGVPAVEPPKEKPEWLEYLKDVADQDFWARSETPVISIADGSTLRKLQINQKVRISHTTEVLGKLYAVVIFSGEQPTEMIDPVYLSDTELKNPTDDLDKRLTALEKVVQTIVAFLTDLFKNFKIGK